jgi:hypothetical protein
MDRRELPRVYQDREHELETRAEEGDFDPMAEANRRDSALQRDLDEVARLLDRVLESPRAQRPAYRDAFETAARRAADLSAHITAVWK